MWAGSAQSRCRCGRGKPVRACAAPPRCARLRSAPADSPRTRNIQLQNATSHAPGATTCGAACVTGGAGVRGRTAREAVPRARARVRACVRSWATVPRGMPCCVGYRAAWDTVPRYVGYRAALSGIPCRVGYRAPLSGIPCRAGSCTGYRALSRWGTLPQGIRRSGTAACGEQSAAAQALFTAP
jgi:hypothetical protein